MPATIRALLRGSLTLAAIVVVVSLLYDAALGKGVFDSLLDFARRLFFLKDFFIGGGTTPYYLVLWQKLIPALALIVAAMTLSLLLALGIGVSEGRDRGGRCLRIASRLADLVSYPPSLIVGVLLIALSVLLLGVRVPSSQEDLTFGKFALMALTLACGDGLLAEFKQHFAAEIRRISTLQYVQFQKVLGVRLFGSYFRELVVAGLGIVTTRFVQLLGGVIVVEILFGYPGIGEWCVKAFVLAADPATADRGVSEVLLITLTIACAALMTQAAGSRLLVRLDGRRSTTQNQKDTSSA